MPDLKPLTIPADAADKAAEKAKETDFYADLTDEERAEEGLPPRETKPAAAEPEKKAEPEKVEAEKPKPGPGDDEEDEDDDSYEQKLFEEIAGLREDLSASVGKSDPALEKKGEDALLNAALEHDDEVVRGLAERLQKAEQRLEARETEARESRIASQIAKDDAEFDAVQAAYLVDGRAMTDKQVEQIEDFILKNPDAGRSLSIEQLARVVFPSATKRTRSAPAKGPADSPNGDGTAVATIVDQGAGSGGATSGAFKPRANETIESAIQEAGKRFGWKR